MRIEAIIFSPIISISLIGFAMLVLSFFSFENEFLFIYLLTVIFAIIAQGIVEIVLLILEKWLIITFKVYLNLASYTCTMIGIFVF
jgi:hypothetical protein